MNYINHTDFYQFTPIYVPKNLKNAHAQILTKLRHWSLVNSEIQNLIFFKPQKKSILNRLQRCFSLVAKLFSIDLVHLIFCCLNISNNQIMKTIVFQPVLLNHIIKMLDK